MGSGRRSKMKERTKIQRAKKVTKIKSRKRTNRK
jgi:hypothetical protein